MGARDRWFESSHPDLDTWYSILRCLRVGTVARLLIAFAQVRFLPPQLIVVQGSVNGRLPGFEPGDGGSIPSPRTFRVILVLINWSRGPAARAALLQSEDRWFESTRDYFLTLSSRSSLECSPPCHGGDRGFKSRWGRLIDRGMARYANRESDGAQNSVIVCGFDSHPCY